MTERAATFAEDWMRENVTIEAYDPGDAVIKPLAEALVAAAKDHGISRTEIEEEFGSVESYVASAFEQATDNEIARLVAKDNN